jgi:hypothetical protein
MKKKTTFALYAVILLTVIVGYNYWSYRCGFCTLSSLLSFSGPALVLIAGNLLAIAILLIIRRRQRQAVRLRFCRCGESLRNNWTFCPACGELRKRQVRLP